MSDRGVERRRLGDTGIEVGCVGLGTYRVFNVRDDAAEARCEAVADAALDAGATLFDSSPMYGESERVLARAICDRREEAVVATKVWARDRALGEQQIERALDLFERVDVYQVHNLLGLDEHLPVLQRLKEEGRIGAIGVTHYLESSEPELKRLMRDRIVDVIQVPYHPGERWVERELLGEAARLGVGVIAMTPLGSGSLLSRPPSADELAPLEDAGVYGWPQALLKWALTDERVSCVIPATSSPDHMRANASAGAPPWLSGDERMHVRRLVERIVAL